jgi:glycosyltransferase involved in cell wall biosynthesis
VRVLYFNQYFTTPKGSYGTRAYEFTRRWVRAGDCVTVVTSLYDKSDLRPERWISKLLVDGVEVRILKIGLSNRHGVGYRALTFAAYAILSCWYALVLPADVVVCSSGPLTVGLPGLAARWLRGRAFVFEVRDLWPEGAIQLGLLRNRLLIAVLKRFERICYLSARRVVAASEGMAQWIEQHHGIQDVAVIPNASDNELAAELPAKPGLPEWASGKQLALYAGAMGFIYDCEQLLRMAEYVQNWGARQVEIVVIGDGAERPILEEAARRGGLSQIHFLGSRSREEVFQWLKVSCCALSIVRDSPFFDMCSPNKIYDAFAVGIPVVQDTQGWIKWLLEREGCGLTVPRGDTEAMSRAVVQLAEDAGLRAQMGENARRVARELFDRDLLAGRMREILHACAGRG